MNHGLIAKEGKVEWVKQPDLHVAETQIKIEVHFAGLNKADYYQSRGSYHPPPGTTNVLGLECSGVVTEVGQRVKKFSVGQKVMALVQGGAFGSYVVADVESVLPFRSIWIYKVQPYYLNP